MVSSKIDTHFVGRKRALATLNALLKKQTASLVVITGRRRIGKSRLIAEFAQDKTCYTFSGLALTVGTTAQNQRSEFSRQLHQQLGLPNLDIQDWGDLFTLLAKFTEKDRVIILLDEISWMGSKDPTFLSKLKIIWDLYFSKNSQLILILCGSVSSWVEENILSSTNFFGRITTKITLDELSLAECNTLLNYQGFRGGDYEKLMLLSVTGGVPWYVELVNPQYPAHENIRQLCFQKNGILVDEFTKIFHDVFGSRSQLYQKIVEILTNGPAEFHEIASKLAYSSSGALSKYLNDLILSGFIRRSRTWQLTTGKESSLSHYRLRDNYLRFYLKYIANHLNKIHKGQYDDITLSALPGWNSIMGLQFENLVLNNRRSIQKKLFIKPEDIVNDDPFFQRKTKRQPGCQIDYLMQTRFQSLYICEIKFSKNPLNTTIIKAVQTKIGALKYPKGFSCHPVIVHVNGVSEEVLNSQYFAAIIDIKTLLSPEN